MVDLILKNDSLSCNSSHFSIEENSAVICPTQPSSKAVSRDDFCRGFGMFDQLISLLYMSTPIVSITSSSLLLYHWFPSSNEVPREPIREP